MDMQPVRETSKLKMKPALIWNNPHKALIPRELLARVAL